MDKHLLELIAIVAGAMAGYGAMFTFLIRWITRKNDELIKIMLGNDRAWKTQTTASLADIRECVDHGDCCAYRKDQENIHERLTEIRTAVVGRGGRVMGEINIIRLVEKLPWNLSRPHWPQKRDLGKIDRVILHQSLGHADPSGNRDVFGINNYHISPGNHISATGCPHICYHWALDDDGSIYLCNELTDVVWHCAELNSRSVGVMLVGDFAGPGHKGGEPTAAQEQAFVALADHLMATLSLPQTAFWGHAAYGKPACPGYTANGWIEKLRG